MDIMDMAVMVMAMVMVTAVIMKKKHLKKLYLIKYAGWFASEMTSFGKRRIKSDLCINSMRILVTGGAGFIGSNLVEQLLQDKRVSFVRVLDNLATGSLQNHGRIFPAIQGLNLWKEIFGNSKPA